MLYDILLFVHIVAAIVWLGGSVMINVFTTRADRAGAPEPLAALVRDVGWVGPHILAPTTLVLLAVGISMVAVNDAWTIGQTWIILALVGFGLTFLTGILFFGPESGRIAKIIEERGPEDPELRRRVRRITVLSRLDTLVLFLIVADMVFKPGL
jgi:uncharacterized membrane protein